MNSIASRDTRPSDTTLVWFGALAGPLYLTVGMAQALTREGFDIQRHALSLLSNGDLGWIQVTNFLLSGVLVIAGALGIRRLLRGSRGGTWGPLLFGLYGVGLIGAGVFIADPGLGFPPGTPDTAGTVSTSGFLHFVFGGIGFDALIIACFVFARRFFSLGDRGRGVASILVGIIFFASFAAIASGSTSPGVILGFYAAVTLIWIWHCALHVRLAVQARAAAPAAQRLEVRHV